MCGGLIKRRRSLHYFVLALLMCFILFCWKSYRDMASGAALWRCKTRPCSPFRARLEDILRLVPQKSSLTPPPSPEPVTEANLQAEHDDDIHVLNNSKFPRPRPLPCGWDPATFTNTTRSQCFLQCQKTTNDNSTTNKNDNSNNKHSYFSAFTCTKQQTANTTTTIPTLLPKDAPCLKQFLANHCYGPGHTIPRVAHYIRFGAFNLTLDAFLSVYSVARFLQPCLILFHGDAVPGGPYWRTLLHLLPNVLHVPRPRPRRIFRRKINVVQHSSDVARLRILLEYGGVYLDFDQLLLNPVDDLLNRSTVLGNEFAKLTIGNGLILARPDAQFLKIWLARYANFNDRVWAAHSTHLPYKLSKTFPNLVHVVDTFYRPLPPRNRKLYNTKRKSRYDWTHDYSTHIYTRIVYRLFYSKVRIDRQDSVMGNMVRHILYGDPRACLVRRQG